MNRQRIMGSGAGVWGSVRVKHEEYRTENGELLKFHSELLALRSPDPRPLTPDPHQITSCSFSLVTSSHEYPSVSMRICSVCSPNSGAGALGSAGVSLRITG